ncbi:MAG: peptidase [Bacteroidota bacterium]|jgi:pimeloyl-ACP methyl ester carboxylesterase|nr:peptidase [Bacteroidota bacterium]
MRIKTVIYFFSGLVLFLSGLLLGNFIEWRKIRYEITTFFKKEAPINHSAWPDEFEIIKTKSKLDGMESSAYFYKSTSPKPSALIVSLHPWNGTYAQFDSLAVLCKKKNINYIHPDFRGKNNSIKACCSDFALGDIDDAINYAIKNANVDTSNIMIIGGSGGGYASLAVFMKTKIHIRKYSIWASICDLESWFNECALMDKKDFQKQILSCTGAHYDTLDHVAALQRSPLYWKTPLEKLPETQITIYAGVFDGIKGPASFTHSIRFYNKLIADLKTTDSAKYVSEKETLQLLEFRRPISDYGTIAGRNICLLKEYKNIRLIIFNGEHEILTEYAFVDLLN